MDEIWRTAPLGALRVSQAVDGLRVEANEAARQWALLHRLGDADWQALAGQCLEPGSAADRELMLGATVLQCRRVELGAGWLIWVVPQRQLTPAERLVTEQLELVQDFGRIGLYMRDLASGVGVWDHHTLRIFGLEATAPTPTYDEIVQRWVHADDVPLLRRHHATIHGVKGRGGLRFRIVRPDGALRHIQSLYEAIPAPDGGPGRLIGAIIDDTEVHERLAAQQQATAELDRAVELAGISIWRVDLANRTIRFNDVGARMNGLADGRNDCALDDIRALIHPDDLDAVARGAELALAGDQAVDVVARYRKLGGGWRTLLTRRVAVRDEQGGVVGLTGISLDFSAEAGARRRAQELAAHTQLVAEAMGVGFWRREANDGPAHWDDQMYIIHHRDPALGPPTAASWVDELVHPQDRLRIAEQRRQAQANWDPLTDTIFRAADVGGGERWVRIWTRRVVRDGQRLSFGMHLDVTERHQATLAAEREQERSRFAIDAADIGVWERALDGRVTYWNNAMYRLRGIDPSDPRSPDDIVADNTHPDDHAAMLNLVRRHIDEGVPYHAEIRMRRGDGNWRWLATQGRLVRDAEGRMLNMVGVNFDITERKDALTLRTAKERAEQASRDKSAFLARVSHELRTPMNAVLGFAQLIAQDLQELPSPRQHDRLQHIRSAGNRLMALIDDVLDLARFDTDAAPVVTDVSIAAVLGQARTAVAALAGERRVTLGERGPGVAATLRGDPHRLAQALTQLLTYAVRRQPDGGWVEVELGWGAAAAPAQVEITLRDGGAALSAEQAATLFEPFGDASAGDQGHGLGLSLALRAVQSMGGLIDVSSPPGADGTLLRVCLPALPVAAAPAPLVVLCVEDNPVNMMLVRELLAMRPGVRLVEAVDGGSGIAAGLAERPDVALLDLQLPDMDGIEVMRRLRAEPGMNGCRYIALSANAMPEDIAQARAAGFDDYWTKPIQFDRFLSGIDRMAAAGRRAPRTHRTA